MIMKFWDPNIVRLGLDIKSRNHSQIQLYTSHRKLLQGYIYNTKKKLNLKYHRIGRDSSKIKLYFNSWNLLNQIFNNIYNFIRFLYCQKIQVCRIEIINFLTSITSTFVLVIICISLHSVILRDYLEKIFTSKKNWFLQW